jgi:5'-3' exonuclease
VQALSRTLFACLTPRDRCWLRAPQSFFERYGFEPERYALLGALLGRPRDGVPRVVGVGDRAAAALVRAHGTADAILHAAGAARRCAHDAQQRQHLRAALRRRSVCFWLCAD